MKVGMGSRLDLATPSAANDPGAAGGNVTTFPVRHRNRVNGGWVADVSDRKDGPRLDGRPGEDPERNVPEPSTILVVEDDDDVRSLVVEVLRSYGFRVLVAPDGPKAVDILRSNDGIDLLFSDVVMPGGMSGRELAEVAAEMRPSLKILLTSGYLGHPLAVSTQALDMNAFLEKPYRPVKLVSKIRSMLSA